VLCNTRILSPRKAPRPAPTVRTSRSALWVASGVHRGRFPTANRWVRVCSDLRACSGRARLARLNAQRRKCGAAPSRPCQIPSPHRMEPPAAVCRSSPNACNQCSRPTVHLSTALDPPMYMAHSRGRLLRAVAGSARAKLRIAYSMQQCSRHVEALDPQRTCAYPPRTTSTAALIPQDTKQRTCCGVGLAVGQAGPTSHPDG